MGNIIKRKVGFCYDMGVRFLNIATKEIIEEQIPQGYRLEIGIEGNEYRTYLVNVDTSEKQLLLPMRYINRTDCKDKKIYEYDKVKVEGIANGEGYVIFEPYGASYVIKCHHPQAVSGVFDIFFEQCYKDGRLCLTDNSVYTVTGNLFDKCNENDLWVVTDPDSRVKEDVSHYVKEYKNNLKSLNQFK